MLANVLLSGILFFFTLSSLAFIFKFQFLSRLLIITYTALSVIWLIVLRWGIFFIARRAWSKGYNSKQLLVVGTGRRAESFLDLITRHREWGYRVVGFLDKDAERIGQEIGGHPVLGVLDDLPKLLESRVIDEVVLVVPRSWLKEIEECILYCESVGVPATLSTDFFELETSLGVPREMEGFTFLTFETKRLKDPELLVKRVVDIALSGFFCCWPLRLFL